MDLQLSRKIALVTGASRGIGLATVRALEAEGVRVVAASRSISDGLRSTGAITIPADLSHPDAPAELVAATIEKLGGLDILVNNVGGGDGAQLGGLLDFDDATWRDTFELNFFAAMRTARAAMPGLLASGGVIVNISSIGAKVPGGNPLPYASAKAALDAFGKSMSEEFGPRGVRVKTVSPGPVRTAMWESPDGHGAKLAESLGISHEALLQAMPGQLGLTTGRLVEPEEVAAFVTYLTSPLADSIVGSDHLIDAGAVKSV
ncbi:SDR family NAD(P)-dependent oxidoreductase [Stackebrandtia nassauensis]|uniref:Short-chain dehydrogenase/reductase SDR n=1 Tax=Stackebrandtia nassauensis (strain DSM 44728 / CIP 108903 / NRRL B-16338 / NBRC 102104 / LLR-40K-21) TaxID=446470 RepID=D3Q3K6_STANL|nr:SDR family oxidoreductase [Stackebrandtia nassauensis]ADD42047.1 short-chain dehydrogenase/reductase SDR [Stackebrandtia nassauensis DSM 44728]